MNIKGAFNWALLLLHYQRLTSVAECEHLVSDICHLRNIELTIGLQAS